MHRTTAALSLLLASGIVAAGQSTPPEKGSVERPVMTSFGELRPGGNAFNPVYTFQQIPAKVAKKAKPAGKAKPSEPATPTHTPGEVQEL